MRKFIVILVILAVGGYYGYDWYLSQQQEQTELTLYGNVDIHQVDLGFRVPGRIVEMLVDEGTQVEAGQVLAKLDARPLTDSLRLATADLTMQKANLTKYLSGNRDEEVAQAKSLLQERQVTVDNLQTSLNRLERLRKGAVSIQDLDDAKANLKEAVARLNSAKDQYNLMLQGFRIEEKEMQEAAVEAAQAQVALARINLEDTILYAPEKGTVLTKVREKGSIVQMGQSVYILSLSEPVYLRAFIPQPLLGRLKPGAKAQVQIDAFPHKLYQGYVGFISPTAEFTPKTVETKQVRNDLVYRLRVIVQDPDNDLRQGMPVTIQVAE